MPTRTISRNAFAVDPGPRRRLTATLLICWTVLVAGAVWWLIRSETEASNLVFRMGTDQVKSWSERVREGIVLARVNLHWAFGRGIPADGI